MSTAIVKFSSAVGAAFKRDPATFVAAVAKDYLEFNLLRCVLDCADDVEEMAFKWCAVAILQSVSILPGSMADRLRLFMADRLNANSRVGSFVEACGAILSQSIRRVGPSWQTALATEHERARFKGFDGITTHTRRTDIYLRVMHGTYKG